MAERIECCETRIAEGEQGQRESGEPQGTQRNSAGTKVDDRLGVKMGARC